MTAGRGTDKTGQDGGYSSSESEGASLRKSTLVRVARLCGTQRSLPGSFPTSWTSDTIGASKPTVNWVGAELCSDVGKMPWVLRCLLALERTAKLFVQLGIGHLYAGNLCYKLSQALQVARLTLRSRV